MWRGKLIGHMTENSSADNADDALSDPEVTAPKAVPQNQWYYWAKRIAVSYTHLTLPTKA